MVKARWVVAAGVVVTAMVLTVAGYALLTPKGYPVPGETLAWTPCPAHPDFDCATLTVPLDYAHPDAGTIGLAVNRLRATDPHRRLGALVTNPGGPGESGLEQVFEGRTTFQGLSGRYDIIGFDPRGVGASSPVRCLDDRAMDEFTAADMTPATPAETGRIRALVQGFAAACAANSGRVLPFVGTENTARDVDRLRAALGERKLAYLGFSYGTLLGQYYAEQFPGSVGRMVLDSVADPDESDEADPPDSPDPGTPAPAPDSAEAALRDLLADCTRQPDCPVGTDESAAVRRLDELLAAITARPLPTADGRTLTGALARTALFHATYSPDYHADLRDGLRQALAGTGDGLLALADQYYQRDEHGHYTNSKAAFAAVTCLSGDRTPEQSAARLDTDAATAARNSPHFGAWLTYSGGYCAYWPTPPTTRPHPVTAPGAPPILLVNTTRDGATPLDGAQHVAKTLGGARLVVSDADGHIAYGRGDCVDRIVNDFLLDGKLPAAEETWPAKAVTCPR